MLVFFDDFPIKNLSFKNILLVATYRENIVVNSMCE